MIKYLNCLNEIPSLNKLPSEILISESLRFVCEYDDEFYYFSNLLQKLFVSLF